MTHYPTVPVRHVFTYGTLMSSAGGAMGEAERALLRAFAKRIGVTVIGGRMFDAGACPAVVLEAGADDVVTGEVWQVPSERADVLEALDRYEGCAPESPLPHPYARRAIVVGLPSGEHVAAWIYVWALPTDGLAPIASGKWNGPSAATLLGRHVAALERIEAA